MNKASFNHFIWFCTKWLTTSSFLNCKGDYKPPNLDFIIESDNLICCIASNWKANWSGSCSNIQRMHSSFGKLKKIKQNYCLEENFLSIIQIFLCYFFWIIYVWLLCTFKKKKKAKRLWGHFEHGQKGCSLSVSLSFDLDFALLFYYIAPF